MPMTEKDHAEIRRLTVLKMAIDSRGETELTEQIIARAKQFEKYIVGEEPDEKS